MFNIGMNIDFKVDPIEYPIKFTKGNICVHCGKTGTLKCVDSFGRETKKGNEIYPFEHIKCEACGRVYSIEWIPDPDNPGQMRPVPVNPSLKQQFLNSIAPNKDVRLKIVE